MPDTGTAGRLTCAKELQEYPYFVVLNPIKMAGNNGQAGEAQQPKEKEICGIIMPIAETVGYPNGHWLEVKTILYEAIISVGYNPNIVSYSNDTGVIHNRIIGNLFNNPIVVCDVSSRNPNVMFELGMRLAFDKAVVVITDDNTKFSFDTQVVEHLIYPFDLNYLKIVDFKEALKSKIRSTVDAFKNPNNPTFLKSFIQYKPKLNEETIGTDELILKRIEQLADKVNNLMISETTQEIGSNFRTSIRNVIESCYIEYVYAFKGEGMMNMSKEEFVKSFLQYLRVRNPRVKFDSYSNMIERFAEKFIEQREDIYSNIIKSA